MDKIRAAWVFLTTFEPARLRGIAGGVLVLLAGAGFVLSADATEQVDTYVGFAAAGLSILQYLVAEWTRRAVVPVARYEDDVAAALEADPPGRHAAVEIETAG